MPPTTILSLGGTAPSLPSAEAGMKYGTAARALAPAAVLRNRRRERADLSGMVVLLDVAWLARIGGMSRVASAGRSAAQTESSRIVVHRRGPCQAVGRHEFVDNTRVHRQDATEHNTFGMRRTFALSQGSYLAASPNSEHV